MSNSYVSGCGATVEIMEGCEARFDLRLSIEEIKIVIMGLKKRLKKAKTEKTINKFQKTAENAATFIFKNLKSVTS